MSNTVPLRKALETHKGLVKELVLNEPTARPFIKYGEPFIMRFGNDGMKEVSFDNKAVIGFLVDMTGHDELVLEGLSARDYTEVRTKLVNMLQESTGAENPIDL
ncbi:hypothetical protein [Methylocystis hirsuta]|uniref:Uncharacterized protein n=1 Tax=Methylocystis hirsuta TaxID=369798 RepID=A0A3M9XR23_9HYPH|nr:hypothetical protein [Methylocystis hirsuta]RNJ49360.1 hypothetical protein D1O30_06870 [Methylocystis hirsuta]